MSNQENTTARRYLRVLALGVFRQYLQFCVVGLMGMAIDMGVLFLLSSPSTLGWNLSLAKAIAAEVSMLNNFAWNDAWTFRQNGSSRRILRVGWLGRFGRFNLICLTGVALSIGFLDFQVYWLHFNMYLANFIAIVIVSLWNFVLSFRFGWKREKVVETTNESQG